jgi:choline dehydrogenase
MLSGIGPAAHLAEHGIPVVADRPGVGANLQDHRELYIPMQSRKPVTRYRHLKAAVRGHGFQAHVGPMRSPSRGRVRLASADPEAAPKIAFNYMAEEQDWIDFRRCIRLTREIFAQPAFASYAGAEIQPGPAATSDDELDAFVREHVESAFHPCGTARLGRRDDPLAVVDPECRVIGVDSLRVADSSVFPRITNGNLNAPSIMVGEKAADHVLGRPALPAWNAAPWINPRWQVSDR